MTAIELTCLTTHKKWLIFNQSIRYKIIYTPDQWLAWNEETNNVIGLYVFQENEILYEFNLDDNSLKEKLHITETEILSKHPSSTRYLSRPQHDNYFAMIFRTIYTISDVFGFQDPYVFSFYLGVIQIWKLTYMKELEYLYRIELDHNDDDNRVLFYRYDKPYLSIQFSSRIYVFFI